jgi:hypothetical protein
VLLGEVGPVTERDVDLAGLDPLQRGAEEAHEGLGLEALSHALGEGGIGG